jgi:hypothetical protein
LAAAVEVAAGAADLDLAAAFGVVGAGSATINAAGINIAAAKEPARTSFFIMYSSVDRTWSRRFTPTSVNLLTTQEFSTLRPSKARAIWQSVF